MSFGVAELSHDGLELIHRVVELLWRDDEIDVHRPFAPENARRIVDRVVWLGARPHFACPGATTNGPGEVVALRIVERLPRPTDDVHRLPATLFAYVVRRLGAA